MTVASIDIGTNTILLLIGTVDGDGRIIVVHEEGRMPRLGQGVDATGRLAPEAIRRALGALKEYHVIVKRFAPERTIVTATSAVRDAADREDFLAAVRTLTGWTPRVLSGAEEAAWTFRGTVSGALQDGPALVIDIGGGSTELSSGSGVELRMHASIDAGAVRLTERFGLAATYGSKRVTEASAAIDDLLVPIPRDLPAGCIALGVAGTPTTLAMYCSGMKGFDRSGIDGYRLTREDVEQALEAFIPLSPAAIRALGPSFAGREDLMTAGTLILARIMHHFTLPEVRVSVRGLRYGALLAAATGG